jgi:hypothetical protein
MLSPGHAAVMDELVADFQTCVRAVREGSLSTSQGDAAARYS